jgi:hypothetical protein
VAARFALHRCLFTVTALTVWQQHRKVFRAAGWFFGRFWMEAWREFGRLETRVRRTIEQVEATSYNLRLAD